MSRFSYRFDGSSFTGSRYTYAGPSSAPCRKVFGPTNVEMNSRDAEWATTVNNSYIFASGITTEFTVDKTEACSLYEFHFTNLTTNPDAEFLWDFGDSTNSTEQNPAHIYTDGDIYSVRLSIPNYSLYNIKQDYITAIAPVGIVFGGSTVPFLSCQAIEEIQISTLSDSSFFGNLAPCRPYLTACSSSTRGLYAGGYSYSTFRDDIGYVTIQTHSNAYQFGSLSVARQGAGGCSSSTRGIFAGGNSDVSTILKSEDYITISTIDSTQNFGDLVLGADGIGACSSPTQGFFISGMYSHSDPWYTPRIEKVTIATTGSGEFYAYDQSPDYYVGACSSSTRGILVGGKSSELEATLRYISLNTDSMAGSFGNLSAGTYGNTSCSSWIRGIITSVGDEDVINGSNVIEYITIATTGNSTDFGDLILPRGAQACCSSCHGGLS